MQDLRREALLFAQEAQQEEFRADMLWLKRSASSAP